MEQIIKPNLPLKHMLFIAVFALSCEGAICQKRLALIIGNSDYKYIEKLVNPANDASDMAIVLRKIGFDVMHYQNLNKEHFKTAILNFFEKIQDYEEALVYYAGHGIEVSGNNYLLPIDCYAYQAADILKTGIRINALLNAVKSGHTNINVIILDACRSNPFSIGSVRSLNDGLALMDVPDETIVSFATSPGKVASDGGTEGNGIFTAALLAHLPLYDVEIKEVFERVRKSVIEETNGKQVPNESTSLTKSYFFRRSPEIEIQVSIVEGTKIIFNKSGTLHAISNIEDVSFIWYKDGNPLANTPSYNVNSTGEYYVRCISARGQMKESDPIQVKVDSFIDPKPYIQEGAHVTFYQKGILHAKSNVPGKFFWKKDQKTIGHGATLEVDQSGLYNLTITTYDSITVTSVSTKVIIKKHDRK